MDPDHGEQPDQSLDPFLCVALAVIGRVETVADVQTVLFRMEIHVADHGLVPLGQTDRKTESVAGQLPCQFSDIIVGKRMGHVVLPVFRMLKITPDMLEISPVILPERTKCEPGAVNNHGMLPRDYSLLTDNSL